MKKGFPCVCEPLKKKGEKSILKVLKAEFYSNGIMLNKKMQKKKYKKRERINECHVSRQTNSKARFTCSLGPSKITSSWICKISFQSVELKRKEKKRKERMKGKLNMSKAINKYKVLLKSFSSLHAEIFSMAIITTSAAPPWIGVFIAALSAWPKKYTKWKSQKKKRNNFDQYIIHEDALNENYS